MKKNFNAAKSVAIAALAGNMNNDVARRMVTFITEQTSDSDIICALLQGLIVNVKVNNKEKLAEIIGNYLNEIICEIKDLEVSIYYQNVCITYICKRFAKTADETKVYNTNKKQDDVYTFEVKVQDSYIISIHDFDLEDSVEFEIV